MSRILSTLTVMALVLAACTSEAAVTTTTTTAPTTSTQPTTTTTSTSTTTLPPTTTTTFDPLTTVTTIPEGFASPLNGLPAERDGLLDRRAIAIKVADELAIRPQSGVMDADLVIENRIAASKVRWMVIYHDNDSDYIGSIRSVRPTDSALMARIGAVLVPSGGQPWIRDKLSDERGVELMWIDTQSAEGSLADEADVSARRCFNCGFRIPGVGAPHDLFTRTDLVRKGADALGYSNDPPESLYPIVQWTIPDTTADEVVLEWSDTLTIQWRWDGEKYLRSWLTGSGWNAHMARDRDGNTQQIAVDVLVIFDGEFFTQFPPPEDSDWSAVPATVTTGTGNAWVFARGAVWEGTWLREQLDDPYTLLNADGTEAGVPPGFAWVSIFPDSRSVTWE